LSCPNASPIKTFGDKLIGHPLNQRGFPLSLSSDALTGEACGKDSLKVVYCFILSENIEQIPNFHIEQKTKDLYIALFL